MNKSEIEDEIKFTENIIKVYKENNTPVNLYIPILFRLSHLKNNNPQPLPLVNVTYHDVIIDLNENEDDN